VVGNDAAVAFGAAAGNFELNVMMPVIARNLLSSLSLLSHAASSLADLCVAGITADAERLRRLAESSPAIVTALNPFIGYEAAAAVAHQALETGATIREVVMARGHVASGEVTEEQLDRALDVMAMARPHR
jgi:fumarate hydratase class II